MTDRLAIVRRRLHEQRLVGDPVVIDGVCVGSWKRTLSAREVVVEVEPGTTLDGPQAAALDLAAERFGSFLGLPASLHVG